MDLATAYELAAKWHDKNARGCRDVADDYMRDGPDVARNAKEAAKHHAASAAGLRLAAIELRRKALAA
jgi:hypothetical protein